MQIYKIYLFCLHFLNIGTIMSSKNMFFFSIAIALFFTSFLMLVMQAQEDHMTTIRNVTSATAIVGSVGFFFKQAKPRNKFLGLFIMSCAIQQTLNIVQNCTKKPASTAAKKYKE
jgi:hypothetical protein